jgi:hypothetical protein
MRARHETLDMPYLKPNCIRGLNRVNYPSSQPFVQDFSVAPPHYSCKGMQQTTKANCPACKRKPNLIHRIFSITFHVPAITLLPLHSACHMNTILNTPQDLTNHLFLRPAALSMLAPFLHLSVAEMGLVKPNMEIHEDYIIANHFPRPKLGFVGTCLEMCSIFICFQLFLSADVSPRPSYLLFTCHFLARLLSLLPSRRS